MSLLSASCLRSSAQLVVLVTYFSIFHAAAERRPGRSEWHRVCFPYPGASTGLRGPRCYFLQIFRFFSRTRRQRLRHWPAGWKELRASYSLRVSKVNSFAQLLDTRARQESGSQESYQKHSSTFIRLFPLSDWSHTASFHRNSSL